MMYIRFMGTTIAYGLKRQLNYVNGIHWRNSDNTAGSGVVRRFSTKVGPVSEVLGVRFTPDVLAPQRLSKKADLERDANRISEFRGGDY